MVFDLVIVGGGPAGTAAGVYAARKQLKTLLIAEEIGGQSNVSTDVQNWIGTISISGMDLAKSFEDHLKAYAGDFLTIVEGEKVIKVEKNDNFIISTKKEKYETKTVLISSGASRRKLDVPGAKEFDQKGLTYCASCDGPVFSGMDVVVVGGGNAGFETAAQLLAYTKSVTLLTSGEFKADEITVEKVLKNEKMKAYTNIEVLEILGDKMVTGIKYKEKDTGEEKELKIQGVFVEIGLIPNTSFLEGFLELDEVKKIVTNPKSQTTSVPGVWAAGDATDGLYHQNNIAAGDAVKALEDIYNYLHTK